MSIRIIKKITLTQVEIESVYNVICAAPIGCFTGLYRNMNVILGYNRNNMGRAQQQFVDLCKRYCMKEDAKYDNINMELNITNEALICLNAMLVQAGYNVIRYDDEDDRGLKITIL